LLALLATGLGVFSYLTRSARLVGVVESFLEDSVGCVARVRRVDLTWGGVLTVDGVDLSVPAEQGEGAGLLHSDRVVVRLRLLPLLIGRARASSVALTQPTLYLTEDLDDGRFNYEKLIVATLNQKDRRGLPEVLPELFLSGGRVRFGQVTAGVYRPVDDFLFDGTLTADQTRAGGYTFVFNQHAKGESPVPAEHGPTVRGTIDLREPSVEVRVDRFTFAGPHRYLLPRTMRLWWDRLSPRGDLPTVIFKAHLDESKQFVFSALMKLDGIGLSLPIQEGAPLRLADVSGRVILTEGGAELQGLTGELEGITFAAEGHIGFEVDAPMSITVSTDPFVIPAEGGLWPKLPPVVRRYQQRFSPEGSYQTKVTIERPTPGGKLRFHGYIDLLDTRFKYNKFPYPAERLTGRVTFNEQRVELHDLAGIGPSGGHAIVSGTIIPPGSEGKVDITIRVEDLPFDDYLLDAMKPKHREVMDMFFNREGYEDLITQGVVRPPGEQAAGAPGTQADVPEFQPGGTASMVVRLQRPAGPGEKFRVTTDLDVTGQRCVFSFWNYPVIADSGRIVITPEDVKVRDVHLHSIGGGGGVINGWLELPGEGRGLRPHLQLSSVKLPIDNALVTSIPKPKDQWVRSLHLTGTLIGTGEVYADADGQVAFTIDTRLRDGTAAPNGGAYPLDGIRGSVTIERTRVQFEKLVCRHGDGTITLDGQTNFGEHGLGGDLKFIGDNLRIEPSLVDLLPTGHEGRSMLSGLFDDYRPDGRLDAELHYQSGDGQPDRFTLGIEPDTLSLDYSGQRIELSGMTGLCEITPWRVVLHQLAGRFPAGTFTVEGEVRLGKGSGMNVAFDVNADRIDATSRAVLPPAVLTIIDKLSIQGPYSVKDAHLLTWPTVEQGPTMIFEGNVRLRDAKALVGVPVTELDAALDMRVVTFADQRWPHTDIRIRADRLRAADRLIQRVTLRAQTGKHPWLIELTDMKGTIYGGALVGRGQLRMGEDAAFGFDLTFQEVELDPFLNPLETAGSADTELDHPTVPATRNMASGLLSAGLTIRIPTDDPGQRQGRGVVTVRDAKLYDRPITLALLQAVNLALPNESSFDRAAARFLIYGDTVRFDDIRFEAPAFVIAGTGTMDYPTTGLNLRMVTQNPAAPDLGPVSSLVQTFKNELLGIEVHGTLAEPKARVVPLEGLFRSWGRVFGNTRAELTDKEPAELMPGKK